MIKQQSHASLPSYLIICNKTLAIFSGFISSCVVKCSSRAAEKQTFPGNIIEFQTHHVPSNNQQGPPSPLERPFPPSYYHPLYTHLPKERKRERKRVKRKKKRYILPRKRRSQPLGYLHLGAMCLSKMSFLNHGGHTVCFVLDDSTNNQSNGHHMRTLYLLHSTYMTQTTKGITAHRS